MLNVRMRYRLFLVAVVLVAYALIKFSGSVSPESSPNTDWQSLVTFISLFIALVASVISFYLYRWRRILLATPHALVPEEWAQSLDEVTKKIDKNSHLVGEATGKLLKDVEGMVEVFMTFNQVLDEKDAEIKRLKKGYDQQVFAKFLSRFVRLKGQLEKAIERTEGSTGELENIQLLLEDAIEECGVIPFNPDIGADYRDTGKEIEDDPEVVETDDPEQEYKIARVLREGYRLSDTEEQVTIVPARVEIYKLKKESEK